MNKLRITLAFIYILIINLSNAQHWISLEPMAVMEELGARVLPVKYQVAQIEPEQLINALEGGKVELLLPDATVHVFNANPISNFAPRLQEKYSGIRTYSLQCLDNPKIKGRLDFSPQGMHAVLKHPSGEVYIDPFKPGETQHYLIYHTKDYRVAPEIRAMYNKHEHHFVQDEASFLDKKPVRSPFARELEEAVVLRTYRIAICATGEYAAKHDGTVEGALAAMNTALNRINFVLESELAIHLQLVENNDELIFFDGNTDPFSDGNPSQMALENNNYLIANLGSAAYDVGHVFGSSCNSVVGVSGGVGIVCGGMKGFGASCEISTSDRFYIGIVCHELGHQFGAQHTWNNCPPAPDGQFNGRTAFEPGSGSTIMSYAGACGSQNVAFESDNYYHSNSIEDIKAYIMSSGNCAEANTIDNHDPMVSINLDGGFYIPVQTPFKLTASGSDMDGDTVYYNWEQFDAGTGAASLSPIENPKGDAPIFRSLPPTLSPTRFFPSLTKILNNTSDNTEVLPTYDRKLTFRVTARDQNGGGGGVSWDEVTFRAAQSAGPFKIKDENIPLVLNAGTYFEIEWEVANTDLLPVNCQKINVRLSTDGGQTYPYLLAANTANDGSEFVLIPDIIADDARIMIEAADNIFFDINDSILTITPANQVGFALDLSPHDLSTCIPSAVSLSLQSFSTGGFSDSIYIVDADLPEQVKILGRKVFMPGEDANIELDFSEVNIAENFEVTLYFSSSLGDTLARTVNVRTVSSDFSDLSLRQPALGASAISQRPTFIWQGSINATAYVLEVDKSPAFTAPTRALADNITTVILDDLLDENTLYYWRVQPQNECGPGAYSPIGAFHTLNLSCQQYIATDVPKNLSQSGIVVAQSTLDVTNSGLVSDVNITSISGFHDSFGDLIFTLLAPSGKEVTLVNKQCGFSNKVFNLGFDDESLDTFSCQVSFNNQVFKPMQALSVLNGDPVEGVWTLQIADSVLGSGGRIDGWSLELCGSLTPEPPILARLDTLQAQYNSETILDDDVLRVEDDLATADQVLFTLVSGPIGGVLLLDGTPLLVGGQFSQAEISKGSLVYSHNGLDSLADRLVVTVIDGQGAWIGPLTLPIEVSTQVVSAVEYQLDGFMVFPNPVENVLHLTNAKFYQGPATIRIFRIDGTLMYENRRPLADLISIDLQNVIAGLYLVQVSSDEGVANLRFIKQ